MSPGLRLSLRRGLVAATLAAACGGTLAGPVVEMLSRWPADCARAAAQDRPLVLFFSLPGCSFCEQVRQNYLSGLVQRGEIVREVVIDSSQPISGFASAGTHRELARFEGVKVAPVVLLADACGKPMADPIVGGDVAGFYSAYLDQAFEQAKRHLSAHPAGPHSAR